MKSYTATRKDGNYRVIGTRAPRLDALDKVTGAAKFGADIHLSGMLHGKIHSSPHAHAKIHSIDTSKAESIPGVKAVITGKDVPILQNERLDLAAENLRNSRSMAEYFMADKKVLYVGHPVAAVVATDPHTAEEAAKLIEVEYELLPAVLTIDQAMAKDAPLVHDNMLTTRKGVSDLEHIPDDNSNIASHIQFRRGDINKGFTESHIVVEKEFSTKPVHPGFIEPFSTTALWAKDDHVTIWTTTQGSFSVREGTASIIGITESMLKVVPMECGGGFGGKGNNTNCLNPIAALLSRKSGQPVKMSMTRKETFEHTFPASAAKIYARLGVDQEGFLTAAEVRLAYQAGAFPGSPVVAGATTGLGPYKIDNFAIDGYDVVTNTQKMQSYRAPGQPPAIYAIETIIDELAERLCMDPLDFRLKNAVSEGDRMSNGVMYPRIACRELEELMKAHPHYNTPIDGTNTGRGVAVAMRALGGADERIVATINVNTDGTINIKTGSVDLSGTRTTVAMQAAEILGIRVEDVVSTVDDTDSTGWSAPSNGSRITYSTGLAAINAAEEIKRQMAERAALIWEVQPEDVDFLSGQFICRPNPADKLSFKELSEKLMSTGGTISCSGYTTPTGAGGAIFAGNIVDVAVDPETGKVDILRYTSFLDTGKAIHPSFVEGQVQGATAQGIGWALMEEYFYTNQGTMANSTFLDYRMPTSLDLPMIETVLLEEPNPNHPFGMRARAGEIPIVPPIAAIANAIHAATGIRMTNLPMSPGNVMEAISMK